MPYLVFSIHPNNLHQITWMFIYKNIFLFGIRHMSINLRGTDRAMSKHSLDIADVYVLFKKQCGKRMTKHMWSYMLLKPGNVSIVINHETDRLVREFVFKFIYEEIMAAGNLFLKSILIQGKGRNYLWISNLQDSFPGAFSLNQYGIIFQIDIGWTQST